MLVTLFPDYRTGFFLLNISNIQSFVMRKKKVKENWQLSVLCSGTTRHLCTYQTGLEPIYICDVTRDPRHGHIQYSQSHDIKKYRLRFKCDGTRAETRFRLSAKRTSPFKSARASVQSTTGSRGVRISGSNAGYTMFRGSVKGTGYPLHSPLPPSLPLPCVTVCHHASTGLYEMFTPPTP